MTEGHSSWFVRRDRAARQAAKLLKNMEESHKRIQVAKGQYDPAEYDKPQSGED